MIVVTEDNSIYSFESFRAFPQLTTFVTSRHGGFSTGNYTSFNPSPYSGDDAEAVRRNLDKLYTSLPQRPTAIIRPRQVHGIEVRVIDRLFLLQSDTVQKRLLTGIDALITSLPGYAVCVSTADCIPVIIYDRRHEAVAAVHAGWRGTVQRILQHVLQQMSRLYDTKGEDVYAAIGPGISMKAFEVGQEVYDEFSKAGFDLSAISMWNAKSGKHHIDLWKANSQQLEAFGIPSSHIEYSNICTFTQPDDFFSARRLGKDSGRILTGIMINR